MPLSPSVLWFLLRSLQQEERGGLPFREAVSQSHIADLDTPPSHLSCFRSWLLHRALAHSWGSPPVSRIAPKYRGLRGLNATFRGSLQSVQSRDLCRKTPSGTAMVELFYGTFYTFLKWPQIRLGSGVHSSNFLNTFLELLLLLCLTFPTSLVYPGTSSRINSGPKHSSQSLLLGKWSLRHLGTPFLALYLGNNSNN